ncbi:MAG: sigma-54 dependent transcriptional regulator [Betaproteobacteria bacterium]|nr:sigma-54 dependent transcriptional regulator [Betaproteobacteria bacterium]MDH4324780.1 sigma-54 dependent transcriptional regulator [Betaproteobacteria bacterium]
MATSPHDARSAKPLLLIVDDDVLIAETLAFALGADFEVLSCESRAHAVELLRQLPQPPQLALVDLGLPPRPHAPDEGFQLIADLLAHSPAMRIVVLSGQGDAAHARHARTLGAAEFIAKPCDPAVLKAMLMRALAFRPAEPAGVPQQAARLVGESAALARLRSQISQSADSPFPVLVEGESGSGKEQVALALHQLSRRAAKPYLALNCAAIAPTLVEPTLFGYVKGAFTGATANKSGYFEDAQDGTLFLDEIGELPLEMQAKLLRVLENGEYQRVGETQRRMARARVIAATNRDLRQEMRQGRFRADLYHRLSVLTVAVPPLREMGRDRLLLLQHFRAQYAAQAGVAPFSLDAAAERAWLAYSFPGNVRELRNIVIRLTTKYAGQSISPRELEPELDLIGEGEAAPQPRDLLADAQRELERGGFSLDDTLKAWERAYVEAALRMTGGNVSQAAKLLGVNRTTLYSRMSTTEDKEH